MARRHGKVRARAEAQGREREPAPACSGSQRRRGVSWRRLWRRGGECGTVATGARSLQSLPSNVGAWRRDGVPSHIADAQQWYDAYQVLNSATAGFVDSLNRDERGRAGIGRPTTTAAR